MRPLLAIVTLTWKAALRFRLFVVIAVILLGSVVVLPLMIKDDGTAKGFAQILLTYNLSVMTALLGFSTLWLSCGTLAKDFEENQIQMVAVKPIARWKILFGKWLGIASLNALLLALSGLSVFLLLNYKARNLPETELVRLRNEVLVARGSLRPVHPDLEAEALKRLETQLLKNPVSTDDLRFVQQQIRERVKADYEGIPSKRSKYWIVDAKKVQAKLKDRPMFIRVKFFTPEISRNPTMPVYWNIGDIRNGRVWSHQINLEPEVFYEFPIPPNLVAEDGKIFIAIANPNDMAIHFPAQDGLEILYREGGFSGNYVRGLLIIFFWLGLLSAIGLASATFLSFPVAAFFSLFLLVLVFFSSTMSRAVEEGTVLGVGENQAPVKSFIDKMMLPLFAGTVKVLNLAQSFSPIDSLSSGRTISWPLLARALGQIIFLLGGIVALLGAFIFSRKELATAPGTQS